MSSLREQAISIWQAGVDAVNSESLVQRNVQLCDERLVICDQSISLQSVRRIEVVGGGKAGAGMVRGLQRALADLPPSITLAGWVNVPEDCVPQDPSDDAIRLFGARPAGVNEPTAAGQSGTQEMLRRVSALQPTDICLVLISGGGSALMPAPVSAITLDDKLSVTRLLAGAATPIEELNLVRRELSRVKGGGLLRHCRAKTVVALIVSDVIGDPLSDIASGPTVAAAAEPARALQVLRRCDPDQSRIAHRVFDYLQQQASLPAADLSARSQHVVNRIVGSNAVALAAAARRATELGYQIKTLGSENCGSASEHGRHLFQALQHLKAESPPGRWCLLAGGETTVELAPTNAPRKGGRNQETVLAALEACPAPELWERVVLLSGGTDGEDGPTDAAGAVADWDLLQRYDKSAASASDYLAINNSYPFFDQFQGLLQTGPTHTNVMDLAVGLVGADVC